MQESLAAEGGAAYALRCAWRPLFVDVFAQEIDAHASALCPQRTIAVARYMDPGKCVLPGTYAVSGKYVKTAQVAPDVLLCYWALGGLVGKNFLEQYDLQDPSAPADGSALCARAPTAARIVTALIRRLHPGVAYSSPVFGEYDVMVRKRE